MNDSDHTPQNADNHMPRTTTTETATTPRSKRGQGGA